MDNNYWTKHLLPFLNWLPQLSRSNVKLDMMAGATAGVLVLPQAIALSALAGMPPEYGLYTSIFPVLFAALFGSSWHAMSGPNTALCIVVAFTIASYASVSSPEWIQYAITLAFMAGVIQLTIGFLRLSTIFTYFSQTVMVALITGVGVVIIISQLGNFMGVLMITAEPVEHAIPQAFYALERANLGALLVGIVTVSSGLIVKKYFPKWPFLIIAVVLGSITAQLLTLSFGTSYVQLDRLGSLSLSALPLSSPDFQPETFAEASEGLIPAAFIIAILGLMQASVIARSLAIKSGQNVDMNQETIGQGISNIAGSFLSCFPSCSSFNRSASNIEAGARTPLSAIVSVITLIALVIFAAPLIALTPIAVVAGILILVGLGLIKKDDILRELKHDNESRIIFTLTLFITVYGGLDDAVFLGIALSIIAYLRNVSKPHIQLYRGEGARNYILPVIMQKHSAANSGDMGIIEDGNLRFLAGRRKTDNLKIEIPKRFDHATVIQISGNLFFGSITKVEKMFNDLARTDNRKNDLIISGENLTYIDNAGAQVLLKETYRRFSSGAKVSLWLRDHTLDKALANTGLFEVLGTENIYYLKTGNDLKESFPV